MTRQVEALIASAYLAGTNTRRVKRALAALFKGAIGKDVVSRVWRKVKTDWEAWMRRDLAGEDIVRLILDGSVVRVRLDRKATNISLLVVLGIRRDGQKVLLAVRNMGGESEAAWRGVLDDLVARGLRTPEFLDHRRRRRAGEGACRAVARSAHSALHRALCRAPDYADQSGQGGLGGGDRCEGSGIIRAPPERREVCRRGGIGRTEFSAGVVLAKARSLIARSACK